MGERKILAKNFPYLMKTINPDSSCSKNYTHTHTHTQNEGITLRHNIIKLLKISEKEKIFKAVREKEIVSTQEQIIP